MRRRLGRRLPRSLADSTGQRLEQQPLEDSRRLSSGAGETSSVTLSESLFLDGSMVDVDLTATLTVGVIVFGV